MLASSIKNIFFNLSVRIFCFRSAPQSGCCRLHRCSRRLRSLVSVECGCFQPTNSFQSLALSFNRGCGKMRGVQAAYAAAARSQPTTLPQSRGIITKCKRSPRTHLRALRARLQRSHRLPLDRELAFRLICSRGRVRSGARFVARMQQLTAIFCFVFSFSFKRSSTRKR